MQFLTFQDYLLRSFTLFRLESAYEVREDVADAVHRLKPKRIVDYDSGVKVERTEFSGWARMVAEVLSCHVNRSLTSWNPAHSHALVFLDRATTPSRVVLSCLPLTYALVPFLLAR